MPRQLNWTQSHLGFVEEDLGDPFLQFKVTTSQGEKTVGPPIYRTRYTTKQPNKTLRVVEVDLTKQLPTKWPTATGDFKGDVINYVGVGITDSDFGKARAVTPPISIPVKHPDEINEIFDRISYAKGDLKCLLPLFYPNTCLV